ncbi:hypothetical protein GOV04_04195 [Candidatus Woesearchaeota archaeon]|nr:hypothetical protein [Candidatus Woesearchaeota archaeon]
MDVERDNNIKEKFNKLVENLQKIYGLTFDEILVLTGEVSEKLQFSIPLDIFKNRSLGVLESITVYLKDTKGLKFSQIARALERDDRTIWATYHKAKKKLENGKKK